MSRVIYAYGTLRQRPALRITGLRLDGVARPALIDQAGSALKLFQDGSAWRRAELDLELVADRDSVLEFHEQHGDLSAVAVIHCRSTGTRQSARLTRSEVEAGRWGGTVAVDRGNFRGRAEANALVTAAVGGKSHRLVAEPVGWALHFDEPANLQLQGSLRVRWMDFTAEGADPLAKQFSDASHLVAFGTG
ncbi:MAG: hypothetical protein ACLQGP_15620 [Isosphaeraceae bacterium]